MSHIIKIYAVCKFSYFLMWYLLIKEFVKIQIIFVLDFPPKHIVKSHKYFLLEVTYPKVLKYWDT